MASLKSAAKPRKTAGAAKAVAKAGDGPGGLAEHLLSRAPAEDVAAYEASDLKKAAELAGRAVARHKTGETVVAVDAASERGAKVSWGAEGTSADGTLVYKAPLGFEGIDSITYKVIDQAGHSDLGTILVHVGTLI